MGVGFLLPAEEDRFQGMIESHVRTFAFSSEEIPCVNPMIVKRVVIVMVLHVSWSLKLIPMPRAHPKLAELLKEKVEMGILELSGAPYSNR